MSLKPGNRGTNEATRKAPVTYSKHPRNAVWCYDDRCGVWHTGSSQTCLSREQLEGQKLAARKKCHTHQLLENSLNAVSTAGVSMGPSRHQPGSATPVGRQNLGFSLGG